MYIESGQLRQFRNYEQVSLGDLGRKNLFLGENAAGKTNLLEALYFLSHAKSPRTRQDRELIQWQMPFATIALTTFAQATETRQTVEAQLIVSTENTLKTIFKINGQPVRSRSEIVGKIPTVTFFLWDLLMLRGTPEDRRNALDASLVQYEPIHFKRLSTYHRVRQQKAQWLKQPPYHQDPAVLMTLNRQLAQAGAQIMLARITYLHLIETHAQLAYFDLSQGREPLTLGYKSIWTDNEDKNNPASPLLVEPIEAALLAAMEARAEEEQRRCQVLVGPHRDDVLFFLEGRDACHFGSQGQQRSIVLAFKLAEIRLLNHKLDGEFPILLLDDVMAELDPHRQHQLLAHLDESMQVFLTTTHVDPALLDYLSPDDTRASIKLFDVSGGTLRPSGTITSRAF